jgi:integrase
MQDDRPGLTPDGKYWLSKRPRSDRWYRTWFDDGSRQTRRVSLGTAEQAKAHEALLDWWIENRRLTREAPQTVGLLEVVRRYYEANAARLHSADFVRYAHAKVRTFAGTLAVSEFERDAQRDFLAALKGAGASDGYARRIMSVVKASLAWAVEEKLLISAPMVKLPRDGIPKDRVLSADESLALWLATEHEHERMFLALAFGTLSRPEAILELTRGMVDFDRRIIDTNPRGRIQTKKRRPVVPVVDELLPWLAAAPAGPLVRWRGKPIESFKTAWRAIRRRARLGPEVVAKTIRHTMATKLYEAGVPDAQIQGFLGHRLYAGSTAVYAHHRPDYLSQAALVVNGYMENLRCTCVAMVDRCMDASDCFRGGQYRDRTCDPYHVKVRGK